MFGNKPPGSFGDQPAAEPSDQPQEPAVPQPPQPPQQPTESPATEQPAAAEQIPAVVEQTHVVVKETERDLVDSSAVANMADMLKSADNVETISYVDKNLETPDFRTAQKSLMEALLQQIDFVSLNKLSDDIQRKKAFEVCDKIFPDIHIPLTALQIDALKNRAMDELFGFGPIEPLLQDNDIADIMVNSHKQVYIERQGKLLLTDITFLDEQHLLTIIQRIVSRVGRRVDESSPMVDARMPDGSRFNAIIPPLALDGSLVSIRKFKKNKMPLSSYVQYDSMNEPMHKFLAICGHIGLNMMVSGGTGSGKTTLLNALSGGISNDERIVTIEDAAELQLQQPHVLRLETRPASMEGKGEVTQRQLVKNALRMRPDRIILGEIRGDEVIDVLSAMNTGHDGSMATIHANTPRDCLARIENLVMMSSVQIELRSLRQQISSALQIIVQIERMRDGKRRIVKIEEVVGLEGDIISTQTLFSYKASGLNAKGELEGEFICHGIRPKMIERAEYYGKEQEVLECFKVNM